MEEDFVALLLGDADVVSRTGGRVNFGAHPQGSPLPGIVLNTVSRVSDYTLTGPMALTQYRVQVDCYAMTYTDAKHLSRAVIASLDGYHGGAFQGLFLVSSRDSRENDEGSRAYRVSLDFTVMHSA